MVFRRPQAADKDAPTDLKPEAPTHNIGPILLGYVERVERLTEEKEALQADIKEVWSEAKAVGLDTKILRKIVQLRKMDTADRQELDGPGRLAADQLVLDAVVVDRVHDRLAGFLDGQRLVPILAHKSLQDIKHILGGMGAHNFTPDDGGGAE